MLQRWVSQLPSPRRESVGLFLYSLQTPLLLALRPRVRLHSPERTEIVFPLSWFSKNTWGTMFFGSIAAGADLTGGFAAMDHAPKANVGFLYKDFSIQFLRRVDDDLLLVSDDGLKVAAGVAEAAKTGQRINVVVRVSGFCEKHSVDNPVVKATMTLSLKSFAST